MRAKLDKSILNKSVEELYPEATHEVRAVVEELRALVQELLPDAREVFYHRILGYGPNDSYFDRIVYIAPQKDYANVGFFFGTRLSDPRHRLEGTGKRMRHVKIHSAPLSAADRQDLVQLISEAWEDGVDSVAQLHQRPAPRRVTG